ncbi:MAG: bifunctional phosphoribosylaminoimidazolecarboxamide formyltransferase/IMP cyclohydrolase [Buchnera aphidicola (Meitanaphis flavogallis)]
MKKNTIIRNALISVFDKTGIIEFAQKLIQNKINLFATSGTKKILKASGIKATDVSKYTDFPEIMSGRVKTLHHKIYAGILARSDHDKNIINKYNIIPIDLVIINFYPFFEILNKKKSNHNNIIESIDIGGPTIIRAAAKNYNYVTIVTKPHYYHNIIKEIEQKNNQISYETRLELAHTALQYVFNYDYNIVTYFSNLHTKKKYSTLNSLPKYLNYIFKKKQNLLYGENTHQQAGLYVNLFHKYDITQMIGKTLSYNNVSDADTAISCVQEFNDPACVIVKHGSPCGVAISKNDLSAYLSAYNADPTSAFGGVISFNTKLNENTAKTIIATQFVELIVIPDITDLALKELSKKKNIRILKYSNEYLSSNQLNIKSINKAFLMQNDYYDNIDQKDWKVVSKKLPTSKEKCDALFALKIVKYLKSNAIVYVRNLQTISIGAGQTSRIDAIKIAITKANEHNIDLKNSTLASDGFFPFKDSIDIISKQGTSCIIQPGGSIRDEEIISSVNQKNISMIFTKKRYFKH